MKLLMSLLASLVLIAVPILTAVSISCHWAEPISAFLVILTILDWLVIGTALEEYNG